MIELFSQSLVMTPTHYIFGVQLKTCQWDARVFTDITQLEMAFEPDVSEKQNAWLADLVCKYPDLRYAIKNGEQRIGLKKLKVGGYCPKTNTAFEFDGCF